MLSEKCIQICLVAKTGIERKSLQIEEIFGCHQTTQEFLSLSVIIVTRTNTEGKKK